MQMSFRSLLSCSRRETACVRWSSLWMVGEASLGESRLRLKIKMEIQQGDTEERLLYCLVIDWRLMGMILYIGLKKRNILTIVQLEIIQLVILIYRLIKEILGVLVLEGNNKVKINQSINNNTHLINEATTWTQKMK